MRVLQIVPSISLVYGGPSQMVKGLSAALSNKPGMEVTILTTDSNGDTGEAPLDVPLDRPVEENGYQIRYFRCSPFRRYKFSLDLLQWLSEHASEYEIAHIHALFSPVSSAAATIARQKRLPYIMRPLGTLDPADLRKKRQLKRIYTALWEKGNIKGAAAIHFTSSIEAKISDRFGTDTPGVIVPLGVQLPELPEPGMARENLNIPADKPLILYMSRIDPKKGLDLLIPALETLINENFDFEFVLAGGNPQNTAYVEQIKQQIQSSTLASCTQFPGFVRGAEKAALLRDADLFVLPSYYENFGIAVAEAIASGTPVVISTGVYIWEDIQKAAAGWVCGCDVNSLTDSLRLALSDRQERLKRGAAAAQYANTHYSWSAIAQQTIGVYQQFARSSN
ncbi:hormogonium polysaccharide biosynthesis glycosyltransferase HpsP [Roseofilum reptotaenium CS-1145]|uniref:Glycosyl transferase group 1 n=1 Tax=Roseofilum reptotaenium AO1-A TaxID=1925591 RepID=A0A1L9QSM4_9CYAN|nr:hormogonium polysaccharide biosynthesis glycosyltransferase HpsP [Roseofilum reptotaenium]MDB9518900.1 hormogonium polysaccharide biosynthesis glycosyltransferase HpsP [Roseofilum reptotaenium CS-1145]OJJ25671.1 glycosyl transferase group 1 [Roseofilum reptotaenium AO1-A]